MRQPSKNSILVISDVHGYATRIQQLLFMLEQRGWTLAWKGGRPALTHPTETLVIAGDNNDRGEHSIPWSYLVANSHQANRGVIALFGNHEQFLMDYLRTNKLPNGVGMEITAHQAENPAYAQYVNTIGQAIPTYPLLYEAPEFVVAHAWPYGRDSFEMTYGPFNSRGIMTYERWWETTPSNGKLRIFGHYHLKDGANLGHDALCVDTWENEFTYYDSQTGVNTTSQTGDSRLWQRFLETITKPGVRI